MIRAYRPDSRCSDTVTALLYVYARSWRVGLPMLLPFALVAVAMIGSAGL